jgi:circadian clock protein KaiC
VIDGLSALKNVSTATRLPGFHHGPDGAGEGTADHHPGHDRAAAVDAKSATEIESSTLVDAIIMLRYIEIYGELHRGIAVLKMRGSNHDKRIRELQIEPTGSRIGEPFRTTTGIIPGAAIQLLGAESECVGALFTEHDKQGGEGDFPGSPRRP